jgi:hypothetical protein
MNNLLKAFPIILLLSGCFSAEKEKASTQIYYFDLKTYFTKTATKLNTIKPFVEKTVSKNQLSENKKLKISNWITELALFIDADINKPAWKDSYAKDSSATKIIYTAKEADLKTQKIEIDLKNGLPVKFKINSKMDNLLFHTTEELEFYPDSVYIINKHQKVMLLGENNYLIKGIF